jgi:hypothetical protein
LFCVRASSGSIAMPVTTKMRMPGKLFMNILYIS